MGDIYEGDFQVLEVNGEIVQNDRSMWKKFTDFCSGIWVKIKAFGQSIKNSCIRGWLYISQRPLLGLALVGLVIAACLSVVWFEVLIFMVIWMLMLYILVEGTNLISFATSGERIYG